MQVRRDFQIQGIYFLYSYSIPTINNAVVGDLKPARRKLRHDCLDAEVSLRLEPVSVL
jgi:hypothetical protein